MQCRNSIKYPKEWRTNKYCGTGSGKLILLPILITFHCPAFHRKTCVLINDQAVVRAIGQPSSAKTFGDLADIVICLSEMKNHGTPSTRVDVLFDKYNDLSIRSGTFRQRAGSVRPVR